MRTVVALVAVLSAAGCNREPPNIDLGLVDAAFVFPFVDLAGIDFSENYDFSYAPPFDAGACIPSHILYTDRPATLDDFCHGFVVNCLPDEASTAALMAIGPFNCSVNSPPDCPFECAWFFSDNGSNPWNAELYLKACAVTELPFRPTVNCAEALN